MASTDRVNVRISAGVFISDKEGRLLLVQQADPEKGHKWSVPAGGLKRGESPAQTAVREAREEIGVEVKLRDLIGIYSAQREPDYYGLGFAFRGDIMWGEIMPNPDEIMACQYFDAHELMHLAQRKMFYQPQFTFWEIIDWQIGRSFPLEMIKKLRVFD